MEESTTGPRTERSVDEIIASLKAAREKPWVNYENKFMWK